MPSVPTVPVPKASGPQPMDILGAGGSVLSGLADLGGQIYNIIRTEQDRKYTKEQNERQWNYMVEQNNLTMQREDSINQRTMEDLRRAGINPLVAFGGASSAGASSGNSKVNLDTNLPTYRANFADTLNTVLDSFNKIRQGQYMEANSDKLAAETSLTNLKSQSQMYLNELYQQQLELNGIELAVKNHDKEFYLRHGLPKSVVDKGAQTRVGKGIQDSQLYITELLQAGEALQNEKLSEAEKQAEFQKHLNNAVKDQSAKANTKPQHNVDWNKKNWFGAR